MRCGFELEVRNNAQAVLANLQRTGLTRHSRLHEYHCGCGQCLPDSMRTLIKAQRDCTADGEFITKILEYGTPEMDDAINGMSHALLTAGADVSGNVGNHVHIDAGIFATRTAASRRLVRLMARYERELFEIAAGRDANMRTYNGDGIAVHPSLWEAITRDDCDRLDAEGRRPNYTNGTALRNGARYLVGGSTFVRKAHTWEFRLWNSTRQAWRIRTHVGLSHAMVTAALAGADCTQHDPRCLEDVIGEFMDAPTWAGVMRQRFSKGGLDTSAHIAL